jgi:WD40 repeat protein
VATGKSIATLIGHNDSVQAVAFSPDGKTIALGSFGRKTIRLWNVLTGRNCTTLYAPADVHCLAFSPNGKKLAAGTLSAIMLWDLPAAKKRATLSGHVGNVLSVAFSRGGKLLASGSDDITIKLWDVATGKNIATLYEHVGTVFSVAFSPDGRTLASGSLHTIALWDTATGRRIVSFRGHDGRRVVCVAYSPDGHILASAAEGDETVKLWDANTILTAAAAKPKTEQEAAIAEIERLGGRLVIDENSPERPVISLDAAGTEFDDAALQRLKGFTRLRELTLSDSMVTDAGLEHLKGLTQLRRLDISGLRVTDAGLEHLKGLHQLRELNLSSEPSSLYLVVDPPKKWLHRELGGTRVTEEGVKRLQQALPDCKIKR